MFDRFHSQKGSMARTGVRFFAVCAAACLLAALAPDAARPIVPCPNEMAFIPPGEFQYGTKADMVQYLVKLCGDSMGNCDEDWFRPEYPPVRVIMPGYCIDRYEYPNEPDKPAAGGGTWREAHDYCRDRGKRLCTAREWEKACAGTVAQVWPFGNKYDEAACNIDTGKVENAGNREACTGAFGVFDMSGNLAEWTGSTDQDVYTDADDTKSVRQVRGGSYKDRPLFTRCAFRDTYEPDTHYDTIGFRCCVNPLY